MWLNSDEIKKKNLIQNPATDKDKDKDDVRAVSYDITIGTIINIDGEEVTEWKLKPQGIIEVISREKVKLPANIAGYALVKTSLCNKGILPLNTGIIDPMYEGNISAMLLNFSKNVYRLNQGDVFLRLTFHDCLPTQKPQPVQVKSEQEYINSSKNKVLLFADTFLNLKSAIEQITDKIFTKYIAATIAISAIILALYPFIVTIALEQTNRNPISKEQIEAEVMQKVREERQLGLEARIQELETQISQLKANQPSTKK
jgi:deoxycytidine triphosphate deaminase